MKTKKTIGSLLALTLALAATLIVGSLKGDPLQADFLNPTNSALPFECTQVTNATSSNPAVNSPGNANYGISLWYGVGSVMPYSHLGPTGEELATLGDTGVFEQRYVGTTPNVLAVGAADHIGVQTLTVTCDTGTLSVYTPEVANVNTNMRLYVAKDGSTYHSRADHNYAAWPSPPDLSPIQALVPQHLAKASPTYQPDCYNHSTVTYSNWSCDGTGQRVRTKTVSGKTYDSGSGICSSPISQDITETEPCASGSLCEGTPAVCVAPALEVWVDDNFTETDLGFGITKFKAIQAAVNKVAATGTVNVAAGFYKENVMLWKNVRLVGLSAQDVIVEDAGAGDVITARGAGVEISKITVRGGTYSGIRIEPLEDKGDTFRVSDSIVYGNKDGIVLVNGLASTAIVENNMIFRNTGHGISQPGFSFTQITKNTIADNGTHGYFNRLYSGNNLFSYNVVAHNGGYGFLKSTGGNPYEITYNQLWQNTLGEYGVIDYANQYGTFDSKTLGAGNISSDPLFVDRANGNYALRTAPNTMGSTVTVGTTNLTPLNLTTATSVPLAADGLIGHWKFDGNGKNEVAGSPDAVTVGNAIFKTSGGKRGGYAYIPASVDLVKIPYHPSFNLTNFAIEFWFRQRSNQPFAQSLVQKGNGMNNYNFKVFRQLWNQNNFGPVITGFTSAVTGYWTQTSNPNELAHNEWHHVAYTKDDHEASYYLDGKLIHRTVFETAVAEVPKMPEVDVLVGYDAVDTDIDNLRIYNRALTMGEVLANGGFEAAAPAPLATGSSAPAPVNGTTPALTSGSATALTSGSATVLTSGSATVLTSGSATVLTSGSATTSVSPVSPSTPVAPITTLPGTQGPLTTGTTAAVPLPISVPPVSLWTDTYTTLPPQVYPASPTLTTGAQTGPAPEVPVFFVPPSEQCDQYRCRGLYDTYGEEVAAEIESLVLEDLIDEITAQVRAEVMEEVVRYVELTVVKAMVAHFETLGERADEILANNNRIFEQITTIDLEQELDEFEDELDILKQLRAEFEQGMAGDESLSLKIAEEWKKVNQALEEETLEEAELNESIENLRRLSEEAERAKFENGFAYKDVAYIFDEGYDPEGQPEKYWFSESVITLTQNEYVGGYKDASGQATYEFGPANPLLRAEVAKVSLHLFDHNVQESTGADWYKPYLDEARVLDLSIAREDGLEKVTRGEMMNLIYELGVKEGLLEPQTAFKGTLDTAESDRFWPGFQALYEIGVIRGQGGEFADLDGFLNRAEMAKIIHTMKEWMDAR